MTNHMDSDASSATARWLYYYCFPALFRCRWRSRTSTAKCTTLARNATSTSEWYSTPTSRCPSHATRNSRLSPSATTPPILPSLLAPHAPRIRALRLCHTTHAGASVPPAIVELFNNPLPALEELAILPVEWRTKRETSLPALPTRLRTLALSGVSVPREPAFYGALRALALHECCCGATGFTLEDLVAALGAAAGQLETLDLSRFEPAPSPPSTDPSNEGGGGGGVVRLGRLRSFCVEHEFAFVAALNRRLVIPRDAALHLRVFVSEADQMRHASGDAVLAEMFPPGVRRALAGEADRAVVVRVPGSERFCFTIPHRDVEARVEDGDGDGDGDGERDRVVVDTHGWIPGRRPLPERLRAIM